jgi:hypothetical protein
MKNIFLILFLIVLSQGCSSKKNSDGVPAGALAIFDAANVLNTGAIPSPGCANTNWANTENSSQIGVINCTGADGLAGSGLAATPYRMVFNGVGTSIITNVSIQPATAPEATWIVWVNPSNISSFQHVLSIDDRLGSYNRALVINSSDWEVFNGTGSFNAVAADPNTWQQIVVVFTPTNIILYKNGTPVSYGLAPTIHNTTQSLNIGKSAGGNFDYFQGAIAWVGIYQRALTQTEITNSCKAMMVRFTGVLCN